MSCGLNETPSIVRGICTLGRQLVVLLGKLLMVCPRWRYLSVRRSLKINPSLISSFSGCFLFEVQIVSSLLSIVMPDT